MLGAVVFRVQAGAVARPKGALGRRGVRRGRGPVFGVGLHGTAAMWALACTLKCRALLLQKAFFNGQKIRTSRCRRLAGLAL